MKTVRKWICPSKCQPRIRENDIENDPKRVYLIDDLNPRKENKSDTYFIKTYNEKKKDYSACVISNSKETLSLSNSCDKSNPYHTWKIKHKEKTNQTNTADIQCESVAKYEDLNGINSQKCLHHHFDENGKDIYTLENCNSEKNNLKYDTIINSTLPQYIE